MVHELGSPISQMNLVIKKITAEMAGVRTKQSIYHKLEMVYKKEYNTCMCLIL